MHVKLPQLIMQTAQEHSMQYRNWKQDDYKKKITMFHKNVSDYKTNSLQKRSSSKQSSTQVNERQHGGGIRSSRETCRILRLRRLHHGKIPLGNGSHGGGIPRNMISSE